MAQSTDPTPIRPGLSADVLQDVEEDEGAPMAAAHTGQDRTRIAEHSPLRDRGPKTKQRSKDIINGRQ